MTPPVIRGANAEAFNSRAPIIAVVGPSGTGKTFAILHKMQDLCFSFPNMRMFIARSTRVSLNDSALETFENEVYPREYLNRDSLKRESRNYYSYPNGSRIHLLGMDRLDKILGSRWDIGFLNESSEMTEQEVEQAGSRLQARNGPFNQLILDSNGPPEGKQSWMWKKHERGELPIFYPDHSLNPSLRESDILRLSLLRGDLRRRFFISGPDIFNALPQGKLFKPEYFKTLTVRPADAEWRRGWDVASGEGEDSSRTAGVLMGLPYADRRKGIFTGQIVIAHAVAGRWNPGKRNEEMRRIAKGDVLLNAPQYFGRGWGQGVDMTVSVLNALSGLEVGVWALKEKGSKLSRADSWAAQGEAGNLYVVDDGSWDVQEFIAECCNFTGDEKELNDLVDAGSNANTILMREFGDQLSNIWLKT